MDAELLSPTSSPQQQTQTNAHESGAPHVLVTRAYGYGPYFCYNPELLRSFLYHFHSIDPDEYKQEAEFTGDETPISAVRTTMLLYVCSMITATQMDLDEEPSFGSELDLGIGSDLAREQGFDDNLDLGLEEVRLAARATLSSSDPILS